MKENNAGFSHETAMVTQAVAAINRLNPAFVVITGDLVHKEGDVEQIGELKRLISQIKKTIPVYMVPGNHDVGASAPDELMALYRTNFGNDRFSVSHKNTTLIGINSQVIWAKRDSAENEQYQWIEKELQKANTSQFRFVFAHHPLFLQNPGEEDVYQNIPGEYRNKYIDLFDKYHVQYMFVGHLHRNHAVNAGNLSIIVTNSVSVSHSSEPPGFRVITVYPDKVEHVYYPLETLPAQIE
jgi:3',5'-cyclic AMP phosphodiesterase CpdA